MREQKRVDINKKSLVVMNKMNRMNRMNRIDREVMQINKQTIKYDLCY